MTNMIRKMRKILIFILIVFFFSGNFNFFGWPIFQIQKAQAASLVTAFVYKKDITFDTTAQGANVSTAQANFPVAVHINSSSWSSATERGHFFNDTYNPLGKRVQFFDSDGTTNLSYEVEYYSTANQEAVYWVRVPSVAGNSAADKVTVAYGNDPNGADQDKIAQGGITGVWDTNFKGVWHLGDNYWGTSPEAKDSTGVNNGTNTGSSDIDGRARRGRDFNGSTNNISVADSDSLDMTSAMTISTWVNPDTWAYSSGYESICNKAGNFLLRRYATLTTIQWVWYNGTNARMRTVTRPSTGAWTHVVATVVSNDIEKIYYNGVDQGGSTSSWYASTRDLTSPFTFSSNNPFDGKIDEMRISNTNRSIEWSRLEYYSVAKTNYNGDIGAGTSKFITFGSEQASGILSIDIVDGSGNSVASPSVAFSSKTFSFNTQTSTGTFGTASQKIRVSNITGTQTWTANLAGSATTATWTAGSNHYDFNDSSGSGYTDGADTDSYGGQLTVDPSGGTIAGVSGCSASNVNKGTSDSFVEGTNNSIDLFSAAAGASAPCKWDLTGVSLTQKIPASQPAGSYAINLVLTVS
jgi:hypothetical protein